MAVHFSVYVAVCLLSAVLAATVAYFIWGYRPRAGATWLSVTVSGHSLWALGQGASLAFESPWLIQAWFGLSLIGVALTSVGWLSFALGYSGREELLTTARSVALWLPAVALSALAIFDVAELVFVDPTVTSASEFRFGWGPAALAFFVYGWVVVLLATGILVTKAIRSRNIYRRRTVFFVVAGTTLLAANFVSVVGLSPVPHLLLVPVLFLLVGTSSLAILYNDRILNLVALGWLFKPLSDRFESLAPMARDAVIEEMGSGVVVLDADNRVVDLNPTARRLLGAETERIVGARLDEHLETQRFLDDDLPFLDPSITDGTFTDIWVEYADGTRRCYDVVVTGLETAGDATAGRVGIIHDVTTRQRQRQKLKAQTRELERQNEQLEEFAGIVSHDLRNPINVAMGHVDLSRETGNIEHLDVVETSLDRMEAIVEDVLTLVRQGTSIDETREVTLETVARQAWSTVHTSGASLVVDGDLSVAADPSRFQRLLENLFRNAIEHGGETVTVRVGPLEDDRSGFYVGDDGSGIPADQQPDVFDKGYTTSDDGTGLGLAIVSTIAAAHGWEVSVGESSTDSARFVFDVPARQREEPLDTD